MYTNLLNKYIQHVLVETWLRSTECDDIFPQVRRRCLVIYRLYLSVGQGWMNEWMFWFHSSNRTLLICGMHSGSIRVYILEPEDHCLTSMQAYWQLSVHDNHCGHLQHICCSYDDSFLMTAGDDGNIFSFSLLPPEALQLELQSKTAKVPSPRVSPTSCSCLWCQTGHVHLPHSSCASCTPRMNEEMQHSNYCLFSTESTSTTSLH